MSQRVPRTLEFLFKLLPLQCSSKGGKRTPLCSRSCTGSCRRRSVCLHGKDTDPAACWPSSVDFPALPGSTECPEAPMVCPLSAAQSRRGPPQTVRQGEKHTANSFYFYYWIFSIFSCRAVMTSRNASKCLYDGWQVFFFFKGRACKPRVWVTHIGSGTTCLVVLIYFVWCVNDILAVTGLNEGSRVRQRIERGRKWEERATGNSIWVLCQ